MSDAPARMDALLDLQPAGFDRWLARTPSDGPERLFGGQVASQSLRAATLTVDHGLPPHSFHAYFIRPGRPGEPLQLDVVRTRDGRSFTTRQVTATQSDGPIFVLTASFHAGEEGDDWHRPSPMDVPSPEECAGHDSLFARFHTTSPFEVRPTTATPYDEGFLRIHPFWVRSREPLPDDAAIHACAVAFMSDMGVVAGARAPTSTLPPMFMGASLDHAVWFHRPVRADRWLLFDVQPVSNFGARGLAVGTFRTADGTLIASVTQEALLRNTGRVPLP
jgi:acyl-CoA thioesterase-2